MIGQPLALLYTGSAIGTRNATFAIPVEERGACQSHVYNLDCESSFSSHAGSSDASCTPPSLPECYDINDVDGILIRAAKEGEHKQQPNVINGGRPCDTTSLHCFQHGTNLISCCVFLRFVLCL